MTDPILSDANIWIDHFRLPDTHLAELALDRRIWLHPFIVGELALGNLLKRDFVIAKLQQFPVAEVSRPEHVLDLIATSAIAGSGIGYVDCHLLASAKLMNGKVWTRDKRLAAQALRLQILYAEPPRQ